MKPDMSIFMFLYTHVCINDPQSVKFLLFDFVEKTFVDVSRKRLVITNSVAITWIPKELVMTILLTVMCCQICACCQKKKKKSHQAHVQNFCVCFCLKIYLQAGEARFNYYMLTSFQVLLFQLKCLLNQNDKMIQDIFLGFW